jgi:hypothetical protein
MKEGQLYRLKKNTHRTATRTHGHLWVYTGNPTPARNWAYFTSVATGCIAPFGKARMEPADET